MQDRVDVANTSRREAAAALVLRALLEQSGIERVERSGVDFLQRQSADVGHDVKARVALVAVESGGPDGRRDGREPVLEELAQGLAVLLDVGIGVDLR